MPMLEKNIDRTMHLNTEFVNVLPIILITNSDDHDPFAMAGPRDRAARAN